MKTSALITLLVALLFASGCGSVISKNVLKNVDRDLTLDMVQADPEAFTGRKVVWGGVIVRAENLARTTEVQVMETKLAWDDTPEDPARGVSRGRFIIEARGFLDPAIYAEGKLVTVAGTVAGVKTSKVGKMDYRFPVVRPLELKIVEPIPEPYYYDYPSPWWWYEPYDPFWPGPYPPGYRRRPYYYRHSPYW